MRRQSLVCQFKPYLIVTLASGTVRHGIGTHSTRYIDLGLGNERPRQGRAEQIGALVHGVGAQGREHEVAHEGLAHIFHAHLRGTGVLRFLRNGLQIFLLPNIGHKGHHRTVVGFLQPAHDHGRVEAAGIGQDNLVWCHVYCHGTALHRPSMQKTRSAFCACRRFSASSNASERSLSKTSSVNSSPRCAGRQCMTTAWPRALARRAAFVWYPPKNSSPPPVSCSCPT